METDRRHQATFPCGESPANYGWFTSRVLFIFTSETLCNWWRVAWRLGHGPSMPAPSIVPRCDHHLPDNFTGFGLCVLGERSTTYFVLCAAVCESIGYPLSLFTAGLPLLLWWLPGGRCRGCLVRFALSVAPGRACCTLPSLALFLLPSSPVL